MVEQYIGYTLMTKRADGKPMFLVQNTESQCVFPLTTYTKPETGLATVINLIKETLNLEFDQLELAELTNAVTKDQRIPLFVFNYEHDSTQIDEIILPDSTLEWQVFDTFKETLQKYEISGVPFF